MGVREDEQARSLFYDKILASRRSLLVAALFVIVVTCVLELLADGATAQRPNVIFIMADDLGSVDLGCYGATDMATPNLDALAANGIRLTRFYSAAPVCSASRAALLTGRYPIRCGVSGNAGSQKGEPAGLPAEEITIAETFKAAGYATGHVGKWHLGYVPEKSPQAQGFDFTFGHMGGCIDNYSHFFYWSGPNVHDLYRNGSEVFHDGQYFPDLMVREASQFIEQNRQQPFFLYFAMNMPHYPYQGDTKFLKQFENVAAPRNLYNAFVASQDLRVGQLLEKLDALGLRDNTIVVFQSDNGHSTEERAHYGGGSSGPYRGAKFSLFEGGVRLPAIISWPNKLDAGQARDQTAHACDWLPTLAEFCQVPLLSADIDGQSLTGVLRSASETTPSRVLHWHWGDVKNPHWSVLDGDWKLIGQSRDTSNGRQPIEVQDFLVNLRDDPGERTNVAAQHPEVLKRLRHAHDSWASTLGPRP